MNGPLWALAYAVLGVVMASAQMGVWWITERTWHWSMFAMLLAVWVPGCLALFAFMWFVLIPTTGGA